ncbi:MAG: T9SS type A sorting domain-containing protein [Chitinophagales bacterium]|nr:T9SS type A sorting domain-containing protein [Chitinophagales bacterium]
MRRILLIFLMLNLLVKINQAATITNISASYRNGQTFIVWNVIPNYTGFYYIYRFDHPITNSNIDSCYYAGKVPYNFSLNYFLDIGTKGGTDAAHPHRYLVINRNPLDSLDETKGLFVATCNKQKTVYYAVTSDSTGAGGVKVENMKIVPGANALVTGIAEKVEVVKPILQINDIPLPDKPDMLYDAFAFFGSNVKTQFTPATGNEGCLVYNFGVIPDDYVTTEKKAATFFFFGGGGNAYENSNNKAIDGMYKVSLEDVIPNFSWDPVSGENTKWIGYNENFDVYNANENTPPPTTGIDKTYTIARVVWTLDWFLEEYKDVIDPARISVHGSSSGCTGALEMAYLYPDRIAACDVVNAKLNAEYLNDDNPTCKWNIDGSTRHRAEIFLGKLATNLETDFPKINGTGNYKIWDFANYNTLLKDNKYNSLPVMFLTSGKEDNVTCWEEKIPFYKSVNQFKAGGWYFWDLRAHKGGNHAIRDVPLDELLRYSTKLSYPAFSNCSLNDDPGGEVNPIPPYYSGDTIGSVNGVLNWVDSTIAETTDSWQALVYSTQFMLTDSSWYPFDGLPKYVKTDITPRRLQQFVNISDGAIICMENWQGNNLIQSKSFTYHPSNNGNGLITFKKVKIAQQAAGGSLIKIFKCGQEKSTSAQVFQHTATADNVYPNPTDGITTLELTLLETAEVQISITNLLGERLTEVNHGLMQEGDHNIALDLSSYPAGIYIVTAKTGKQINSYKVIKE